ncbi:hypothetical protein FB45DRAFT_88863 [Roridomyces roridus]|uniref:Uncharacterized protein n=1 Tax=Roridomyces roridus TaxID=1738132 RepID=A0AAD7BMB6_9AGAR|nr:hypothetical protein FB45DRAFT_88863 [Roridomyces roridus]
MPTIHGFPPTPPLAQRRSLLGRISTRRRTREMSHARNWSRDEGKSVGGGGRRLGNPLPLWIVGRRRILHCLRFLCGRWCHCLGSSISGVGRSPPYLPFPDDERTQYVPIDDDQLPHSYTHWRGVSAFSPSLGVHAPFVFRSTWGGVELASG